ncbi:MAG: tRNA 4-thiouridine(8) synthase ThiI [Thermoplasmata archaeon]|nr:tRNA 4-thiouridine(8) synthase ThiI [Thermoplasmata archaeon]
MENEKVVVIHYGEIGLKGKNREFFERRLITTINAALKELTKNKAMRKYGRIILPLEGEEEKIKERLMHICGIKYFSFAKIVPLEMEKIKEVALDMVKKKEGCFRVETSRSNKSFFLNSMDINQIVGEYIVQKTKRKVSLKNPDVTIFIEICEKEAYIYSEKIQGIGGLPIIPSEKVVCLLSGGIDSAAASFLMMKRGCKVIFIHFFNKTIHSSFVIKKIERLVEMLSSYQLKSKLYIIPFEDIQKEIIKKVPAKQRMIIYRRYMMRIANKIAIKEKANAVVTGDSVAQVASQTLDNLKVIYDVSSLPVLPPLIGFDKEDIIKIAKKIGTYEISIMPYEDCCSFMIAKHPETKAKKREIESLENILDIEELINESVKNAKVLSIYPKW